MYVYMPLCHCSLMNFLAFPRFSPSQISQAVLAHLTEDESEPEMTWVTGVWEPTTRFETQIQIQDFLPKNASHFENCITYWSLCFLFACMFSFLMRLSFVSRTFLKELYSTYYITQIKIFNEFDICCLTLGSTGGDSCSNKPRILLSPLNLSLHSVCHSEIANYTFQWINRIINEGEILHLVKW